MIKILAQLTYAEAEKVINLTADNDTPIPIIKNALINFMNQIGQIEENIKKAQEASQAEVKTEVESCHLPEE